MRADVVVHATYLVDINGWRFNFKHMVAERIKAIGHGRNIIGLAYIEDKKALSPITIDRLDLHGATTSNHGTWDWSKWYSFFTPPEDGYNQMIDDAYHTYLLELALVS